MKVLCILNSLDVNGALKKAWLHIIKKSKIEAFGTTCVELYPNDYNYLNTERTPATQIGKLAKLDNKHLCERIHIYGHGGMIAKQPQYKTMMFGGNTAKHQLTYKFFVELMSMFPNCTELVLESCHAAGTKTFTPYEQSTSSKFIDSQNYEKMIRDHYNNPTLNKDTRTQIETECFRSNPYLWDDTKTQKKLRATVLDKAAFALASAYPNRCIDIYGPTSDNNNGTWILSFEHKVYKNMRSINRFNKKNVLNGQRPNYRHSDELITEDNKNLKTGGFFYSMRTAKYGYVHYGRLKKPVKEMTNYDLQLQIENQLRGETNDYLQKLYSEAVKQ